MAAKAVAPVAQRSDSHVQRRPHGSAFAPAAESAGAGIAEKQSPQHAPPQVKDPAIPKFRDLKRRRPHQRPAGCARSAKCTAA